MDLYRTPADRETLDALYEQLLNQWTVAPTSRHLAGRFGETHILEAGDPDAPPILLIPGGQGTAAMWGPVVGRLADTHRVICVDLIDQVGRSRPTSLPAGADDCALWISGVLDELALESAVLMGNSIGAWIATAAALGHPHRTRRLALFAPAATVAPINPLYIVQVLLTMMSPLPGAAKRFTRRNANGRLADNDALFQMLSTAMARTRVISKLVPTEVREARWQALQSPVLVVFGAADSVNRGIPAKIAAALSARPGFSTKVLPDAGHLWNAHDWAQVSDWLRAFLEPD